jgi:hypothetical protein
MRGAFWGHLIWQPDYTGIYDPAGAATAVTPTAGACDLTPTDAASELDTVLKVISATASCAWDTTTYFTIANSAGVFALTLSAGLARVLGFSDLTLTGQSSYSSDLRPAGWFSPGLPISSWAPTWQWERRVAPALDEAGYTASVLCGPNYQLAVGLTMEVSEEDDFRAWAKFTGQTGCTFWIDRTSNSDWDTTHWYRRRRYCVLRQAEATQSLVVPTKDLYRTATVTLGVLDA